MQLTKEQLESVRTGGALHLMEEGTDLVLVRADVYEHLKSLTYDGSPWSDEEMDMLAAEDADRLGWDGMEIYQDKDQ